MATESDLITMLNKLLDSYMVDVGKRLAALEGIVSEFKNFQDRLTQLEARLGARLR